MNMICYIQSFRNDSDEEKLLYFMENKNLV